MFVLRRFTILFSLSTLSAQDFVYMGNFDFFHYLEDPNGGLALFPVPGDKEVLLKWLNEKENLRRSVKDNVVTNDDILMKARALLESKNYLGFVHFSAALAKTGRESQIFEIYKNLFSNDGNHNFVVLYGLFVLNNLADERNRKQLIQSTKEIVKYIKKENIKIEKTVRYPDLITRLEEIK